jgi:hypothetical protein
MHQLSVEGLSLSGGGRLSWERSLGHVGRDEGGCLLAAAACERLAAAPISPNL